MKGKIKSLVPDRGYGFITDESGRDYFFHLSEVVGGATVFSELNEDDDVSFDEVSPRPEKGRRACNVTPAGETS